MDVRAGLWRKLSAEELMLLNCGVGEDSWKSPDCKEIKPVNPKGISPGVHWKDWCWNWNSNTLATWCEELTHLKRPWCWERLKAGGKEDKRGWDGWVASVTWWTWVWASSGSWWWTGACCSPWGHEELDTTEMKWTNRQNLNKKIILANFLPLIFLHFPSASHFVKMTQTVKQLLFLTLVLPFQGSQLQLSWYGNYFYAHWCFLWLILHFFALYFLIL